MEKVYLSTVTPVYQGAAYLRDLCAELAALKAALAEEGGPLELLEAIFVNDSAVDDSPEVLAELQAAVSLGQGRAPVQELRPASRHGRRHPPFLGRLGRDARRGPAAPSQAPHPAAGARPSPATMTSSTRTPKAPSTGRFSATPRPGSTRRW